MSYEWGTPTECDMSDIDLILLIAKLTSKYEAAMDEVERLQTERQALLEQIAKLVQWAESYKMNHVAIALRGLMNENNDE